MSIRAELNNIKRFIDQNLEDSGKCAVSLYELRRILAESNYETVSDLLRKVSPKHAIFELDKESKVVNIFASKA